MKMSYDHAADAMYIELTDKPSVRTQRVNFSFVLDLDEDDQVTGIVVLHVRKQGIDPLTFITEHFTPDMKAELPDPELVKANRAARSEARKRKRQKATQDL